MCMPNVLVLSMSMQHISISKIYDIHECFYTQKSHTYTIFQSCLTLFRFDFPTMFDFVGIYVFHAFRMNEYYVNMYNGTFCIPIRYMPADSNAHCMYICLFITVWIKTHIYETVRELYKYVHLSCILYVRFILYIKDEHCIFLFLIIFSQWVIVPG